MRSESHAGNGDRARTDDDNGPMHLPSGKGSELWFVEKDGQVDVSGLDSPSDCERSQGPMRKASNTDGGYGDHPAFLVYGM